MISRILFPFFSQHRFSRVTIRTWTVLIILFTCYKGYQLGWTSKYVPKVMLQFSAIAARAWYANQGFESLLHLNIVSIVMASAIIILPVILYVFLFRTRLVTENPYSLFVAYSVLIVLSINTFLRFDTPNNYYASRYFLPILLPLLVILYSYLLFKFKSRILNTVTIAFILTFNAYHVYFMFLNPERTERFELIEQITDHIPQDAYVFLISDTFTHRLLTPWLTEYQGNKVIKLNENDDIEEKDYNQLIYRYANELDIDVAHVISTVRPTNVDEYMTVIFENKLYPWSIRYPTSVSETKYVYYIYKAIEYISEISMDNPNDTRFLVDGFYSLERNQDIAWRWSKGDHSEIKVSLKPQTEYLMKFMASPLFIHGQAQIVTIKLNGEVIGEIELNSPEIKEYSIQLPEVLVEKDNRVEFIYSYAKTPKDVYGTHDDRLLAVRYVYFKFEQNI